MIPEFILILSLVLNMGVGDYKQRQKATHELNTCTVTFSQLLCVKDVIQDPEVKVRLKKVAFNKWCAETDEKYKAYNYYDQDEPVNIGLQKQDFEREWHR